MSANWKFLAVASLAAALSVGCSGGGDDDDGGTDGGSVHGDAGADAGATGADAGTGCNQAGNNCDQTQYCETATGQCKKRCDVLISADAGNPCLSTEVCSAATGMCEAACDNDDCTTRTPPQLCDENLNECANPDTATGGCSIATSSSLPAGHATIPTHEEGGVLIFNAMGMDDGAAQDGCTGTDHAYAVSFEYRDLVGNAVAGTTVASAEASLYNKMQVWKEDDTGITWKQGFDHLVSFEAGATQAAGVVKVAFCYGQPDAPVQLLISLKDMDGKASNALCVPF